MARKHIKVVGEVITGSTGLAEGVTVTVIEQTHFGPNFGDTNRGETYDIAAPFGTFSLGSHASTECSKYWLPAFTQQRYFYLRGHAEQAPKPVVVPIEMWQYIKQAVTAYNLRFAE